MAYPDDDSPLEITVTPQDPEGQGILSRISDIGLQSPASGAVSATGSALAGLGGLYDMSTRRTQELFDYLGVPKTFETPWWLQPGQILGRPGQTIKQYGQDIAVPQDRQDVWTRSGEAVGQLIPQILATLSGVGIPTLIGQGADEAAQVAEKVGQQGTWKGDLMTGGGALVIAMAEKMGLDRILKSSPPGVTQSFLQRGKDILAAAGVEGLEEYVSQAAKEGLGNFLFGTDNKQWMTDWREILPAVIAGGVGRGGHQVGESLMRPGALSNINPVNVPAPLFAGRPSDPGGPRPTDYAEPDAPLNLPPLQLPPMAMAPEQTTQSGERAPAPFATDMEAPVLGDPTDVGTIRQPYDPNNPYSPVAPPGAPGSYVNPPGSMITPWPGMPDPTAYPTVLPPKRDIGRPALKGALSSTPADQTVRDELGYYSKAVEALRGNQIKTKKALPAQWAGELQTKGGVSPVELRWSKFLESFPPKQQLTREEVMQHFWDSMPQMTETTMGSGDNRLSMTPSYEEPRYDSAGRRRMEVRGRHNQLVDTGFDPEAMRRDLQYGAYPGYDYGPPQYSSYFSPSGTNYRESIINMAQPETKAYGVQYDYVDPTQAGNQRSTVVGSFPTKQEADVASRANELRGTHPQWQNLEPRGYSVPLDVAGNPIPEAFQNPHWGGDVGGVNPAAHSRMNDIVLPSGEKALHAGELQADWAQGYTQRLRHALGQRKKSWEKGEEKAFTTGQPLTDTEQAEANQEATRGRTNPELPVEPHLPYADDTGRSIDLNIKRLLMRAVNEGYDSVVLGTGQENAFNSDEGSVFTHLTYDPNRERLTLTNPVEGTSVIKGASVTPAPQQDSMIRSIGKGLAGALRSKVDKLQREGDPRPVYEIKESPDDTRPRYRVESDPNDTRPVYEIEEESGDPDEDEMARVEEEHTDPDEDAYGYTESYEEDPDDIPTNDETGEPEHEPRTLYRAVTGYDDVISAGHESEREAQAEVDSHNENLEGDTVYVVYDGNGSELVRYSVNDDGRTSARRQANNYRDEHNSELSTPSQYHLDDPDGNRIESYDDYDDAVEAMRERGGRLSHETQYVAVGPDGPLEQRFNNGHEARRHIHQIGGMDPDYDDAPYIAVGPDGEVLGPFPDAYAARERVSELGGRRHDERPRQDQLPVVNMGPDEVVPKGQDYAVTGSGYHKTYDATVVNRANKILQGFDKKARFKLHDPEAPIKAKRASASGLWEAMQQNKKTLAEMGEIKARDPAAYTKMLEEASKQHHGHRFKITPEFREAVNKKGFSRYKKGGQVKGHLSRFAAGGGVGGIFSDLGDSIDVVPGQDDAFGNQPYDAGLDAMVRQKEQPMAPPQQMLAPSPGGGKGGGGGGMGDIMGMVMKFAPMAMSMMSDERLKSNMKRIGETDDGMNIYRYNYKGSPRTEIGFSAQEVEDRKPGAVGNMGGYKTVNYDLATRFAEGGSVDDDMLAYHTMFYGNGGPVKPSDQDVPVVRPYEESPQMQWLIQKYKYLDDLNKNKKASGGFVPGFSQGGGDIFDYGKWDRQTTQDLPKPQQAPQGDSGAAGNILGTIGSLLGNLIPIPVLGPMIGKFAGHALGSVVEGKTGEIGDMAARDFTMGAVDPDRIDQSGGDWFGSILKGLPGLGSLGGSLMGGGGGGWESAGSMPTDAGAWGGGGFDLGGSGFSFGYGGSVPRDDDSNIHRAGQALDPNDPDAIRMIQIDKMIRPIEMQPYGNDMTRMINKYKALLEWQNREKKAEGGYVPSFAEGGGMGGIMSLLGGGGGGMGGMGGIIPMLTGMGGEGGGDMSMMGPLGKIIGGGDPLADSPLAWLIGGKDPAAEGSTLGALSRYRGGRV